MRRSWGDGPKQIGPQLFIFRQNSGGLLLLQILLVFQGKGTFPRTESRMLVSKESRGLSAAAIPMTPYTRSAGPNRQIGTAGVRKGLGPRARPLVVGNNPLCHSHFLGCGITGGGSGAGSAGKISGSSNLLFSTGYTIMSR